MGASGVRAAVVALLTPDTLNYCVADEENFSPPRTRKRRHGPHRPAAIRRLPAFAGPYCPTMCASALWIWLIWAKADTCAQFSKAAATAITASATSASLIVGRDGG